MSSRHVRVVRTTELPSKTYHITKHHYEPIRYRPGVQVLRQPTVEHKVISGGDISVHRGPKAKSTTVIQRTSPGTQIERTRTTNVSQPAGFMNMQRNMESELNRRKEDWESEVEKMQHNFFDLKTSDSKKDAFRESDFKPRSGNEILTVGDSRNLFADQSDGSRIYRQKFDLHGFDTDDLSVRSEDGKLIITASKEEDMDGAKSTRQFKRSVDIPECVDTDQISSFLDEDGILTIEAPVDETKFPREEPSVIRKTETREVAASPGFNLKSVLDPPSYNTVVESTTQRSGAGPTSSFSTTRTRYLGPDVEDTPYGRKLKTSLYVGRKYKPDDITVKLYDYKINVDAKSEEVIGGRTSRRQFGRDVDIPGPLERDTFRAMLGDDGRLYLGGSFTGNDDHQGVSESVDTDMPAGGRSVNVMY